MSRALIPQACMAAALLAMSPVAALAQNNATDAVNTADPALNTTTDPLATNTADPLAANTLTADPLAADPLLVPPATDPLAPDPLAMNTTGDRDDDGFPWGLLGLLGLAGLLGMKRRDDRDVQVDTRRDVR